LATKPAEIRPTSARDILLTVRAAVYEWTLRTDALVWGANAADVLGLPGFDRIATGSRFDALLDPETPEGRADAIRATANTDGGQGVPYRATYRLRLNGPDSPALAIEDVGRWFADARGRPERAQGLIRVLDQDCAEAVQETAGSRYDGLTGQLERGQFLAAVQAALPAIGRGRKPAAFLIAAIDELAALNETFGSEIGDRMIAEAAHRIRAELRAGDLIGRLSGNRLGLLIMDCNEKAITVVGERFAAAVRRSLVDTRSGPLGLSVSLGGLCIAKRDTDLEAIVTAAERALAAGRERRPGGFQAGSMAEAGHSATGDQDLARSLGAALAAGTVGYLYQPCREAGGRRILSYRLVCDADPDPERIARVTATTGLSAALDLSALNRAVVDLAAEPTLRLSIQAMPEVLCDSRWTAVIRKRLARRPDMAGRLTIELPCATLTQLADTVRTAIGELRSLGIRIAATDFGRGPIDLAELRRLAPDSIELTGDLVAQSSDDGATGLLAALAALVRSLGADLTGGAVADAAAAIRLRALGASRMIGPFAGPGVADRPSPSPDPVSVPA
jgi:diguanylate cyclase (GGDEF)-like protein